MTPEGFKKHKDTPAFAAWLEGVEIEYLNTCGWCGCLGANPGWRENTEYRIKPTPKTVEIWVNIYPYAGVTAYFSRQCADHTARTNRIACVPVTVTYTAGEGL
jgi:hypothetical protein